MPTMASNDAITAGICDRRNGLQGLWVKSGHRPLDLQVVRQRPAFHMPKPSAVGLGKMTSNTFAERLDRAIARSERARFPN
jgi:hypothetical protein